MKKRDSEILDAVESAEEEKAADTAPEAEEEVSGIYVYVGPSVKGLITNGSIMQGKKSSILEFVAQRAEAVGQQSKVKKIERLLVKDKDVAAAKAQLKAGGNGLTRAYEAVLASDEEGGNK
ncbi:MAG: hypothetical protein NC203_00345 [Firmicutes bacterium]|nr:hypothetical protein [[Eubacterium] siraeum]MCM1486788.1 hypothetical protein [Bacillota bacterium]